MKESCFFFNIFLFHFVLLLLLYVLMFDRVKTSCTSSSKECRDAALVTDVSDTEQAIAQNDDLLRRSLPYFRSTSKVKDRSQYCISATHQTLKRAQISGQDSVCT